MRKLKKGRKLSRKTGQRQALLRTLATSLIFKEKIRTTKAKAKELSSFMEKAVTIAKKQDLKSKRILSEIFTDRAVAKISKTIAPRYQQRQGGYTRILKLGPRNSDGAEMAIIEFV